MTTVLLVEPSDLKRSWGFLFTLGVLFVILGAIGLGMVVKLTMVGVLLVGILLIIAGLLQIIDVFRSKHWKGAAWHAFIAILYLIAGRLMIFDPLLGSAIITALIASLLIIIGISRLCMAVTLRGSAGWWLLLFAGIIAIALGTMILMQWPASGLWVIGLFISIDLLVSGWTYIFWSLALRRA